jgi:hypothetical protein
MPELGTSGSVRGARGNPRSYRDKCHSSWVPTPLSQRKATRMGARIASPELLPKVAGLPHVNCSPSGFWGRSDDEEGQHGGSSRVGPGDG